MQEISFVNYDRWKYINNQWVQQTDNNVEMIVMCYRYVPDTTGFWFMGGPYSGDATLGYSDFPVLTLDGKKLNPNFSEISSGVTCLGQRLNYSGVTMIIEHEIAHHIFTNNLNSYEENIHSPIGLMTGVDNTSYSMSPFERCCVTAGWLLPTVVNTTQEITLRDFISTGDLVTIPMPGSWYDTLWIANYQKVSKYDGMSRGGTACYNLNKTRQDPYCPYGKGLFIFHEAFFCDQFYMNRQTFDIENAEGKYDWYINRWVPYWEPGYNFNIPLFEPLAGNSKRSKGEYMTGLPTFLNGQNKFITDNPCSSNPNDFIITIDMAGDTMDAFNMGYDEIFSPYTNPGSGLCQDSLYNTEITIQLLQKNQDGSIRIKIYFDDQEALTACPPGKPKNIKMIHEVFNQQTGAFHPKITWDNNREPDLAGYNIYKGYPSNCSTPPNGYDLYAYVPVGNISFTDIYATLYPNGSGTKQCQYQERSYYYKVEAVDYSNKKSVKSEPAITFGWLDPCAPEGDNPVYSNTNPIIFNVFNYPNPFNPSTDIKFELPQNTFVTLIVYNAVGQVVAELVNNEYKNAGSYSVSFDGSKLASGIYFYSIEAGTYKEVKKMVLIK